MFWWHSNFPHSFCLSAVYNSLFQFWLLKKSRLKEITTWPSVTHCSVFFPWQMFFSDVSFTFLSLDTTTKSTFSLLCLCSFSMTGTLDAACDDHTFFPLRCDSTDFIEIWKKMYLWWGFFGKHIQESEWDSNSRELDAYTLFEMAVLEMKLVNFLKHSLNHLQPP